MTGPPERPGRTAERLAIGRRRWWAALGIVVAGAAALALLVGGPPEPQPTAEASVTPGGQALATAGGGATATQAGYPRPLGTALASDLARLAAQAALAMTAAAMPTGGSATLPPAATRTAFAAGLAGTERASHPRAGTTLPGTPAAMPTLAATAARTAPPSTLPGEADRAATAANIAGSTDSGAPEWLPGVALAVLLLGVGLLLFARRRRR